MVTNPRKGFYGGRVAAPVFKRISDKCFTKRIDLHQPINDSVVAYVGDRMPNLQVGYKGDLKVLFENLAIPYTDAGKTNWGVSRVKDDTLQILSRNIQDRVVPNVVGYGA